MTKFSMFAVVVLLAAPALAQDEGKLDCNHATTQFEMNKCADKDYRAADKALNEAYRNVLAAQQGDDAKLKAAQRAWIAFRDAECTFRTADDEGGSIQPMDYAMCMTTLTRERTKQLRDYLGCEKGAAKCG
jgi:uncharacterized protein YecT (DUF1311 family)